MPKQKNRLILFFIAALSSLSFGSELSEEPRRNLAEFLQAAETHGLQLNEQKAKIESSLAREAFARSKDYPQGSLEMLAGPIPGANGNAVSGTIEWDDWNAFFTSKIDIVLPLYTFGAIAAGKRAAEAATDAERALLERDRLQLKIQVAEYYYGYQLAFELEAVAADIEDKLSKALESAEKKRVNSSDVEKLRSYLAEVKIRRGEALNALNKTRMAMAWKLGIYGKSTPRWDRANLEKARLELSSLESYREKMHESRPEMKALRAEVKAKEALAVSEDRQYYPTLFLGGRLSYAVAPNREPQKSPFANDNFNTFSGGVGLGLKMSLSFWERNAKSEQARIEAIQAQAKSKHLEMGMQVELEKNFMEVKLSEETAELRSVQSKSARKLYQDALLQYALGAGGARELLERLGTYVLAEKGRLESIFNYNMAQLKLEQLVGR